MTPHGGILVTQITFTFLDGTQTRFAHVEYIRQPDGCTLVLGDGELFFVPWSALRSAQWTLPVA